MLTRLLFWPRALSALLLGLLTLTSWLQASASSAVQSAGAEASSAWSEDLAFLANNLPKLHVAPYAHQSAEHFQERIHALEQSIDGLDPARAHVALMECVASLGDSHTRLEHAALAETVLPIRFHSWSDGLRVFAAPQSHRQLVGQRLLAIDGTPLERVEARIAELEALTNQPLIEHRVPQRLAWPRYLHAAGIADSDNALTYSVEGPEGQTLKVRLSSSDQDKSQTFPPKLAEAVSDQRGGKWHHFHWLRSEQLLYIQYNRCATSEQHDLDSFIRRAAKVIERKQVDAVVIDLRYNSGGDSRLGDRLFEALAQTGPLAEKRNVYAFIGKQTFSSAILNAISLCEHYGAILIGTPTSGEPVHFGEVKSVALPRSGIRLHYSTKSFSAAGQPKGPLLPDVTISPTFAQWLAGEDPLLDMALEKMRFSPVR